MRIARPPLGLLGVLVASAVLATPAGAAAGGGAAAPDASGGAAYGAPLRIAKPSRPVARIFHVSSRVRSPRLPSLRVRVDQAGTRTVAARIVFWPRNGEGAVARHDLGRIRVRRTLRVRLPKDFTLQPGRYTVRLHVRGRGRRTLLRAARTPGRAFLTVLAPPPPASAPPPTTTTVRPSPSGYVFPVAGPYTFPGAGGSFGADRGDHAHEGQDISAAEGVPVVAPIAGVVSHQRYQASGAGYYVVLDGTDGRAYFFAHCQKGSVAVERGAQVAAGGRLCNVGSTGRSSGPHLHFEIWVGGWRASKDSRPIDPLPELRAWQT